MGFLSKKEQTFSTVHGSFDFLIFSLEALEQNSIFCPKKMGDCLNVLKSLFPDTLFFEVLLGHTFSPLFYFGDRWCLNDNGWQKRLSVVYFSPTTPHDFSPIAEQQKKKPSWKPHTIHLTVKINIFSTTNVQVLKKRNKYRDTLLGILGTLTWCSIRIPDSRSKNSNRLISDFSLSADSIPVLIKYSQSLIRYLS